MLRPMLSLNTTTMILKCSAVALTCSLIACVGDDSGTSGSTSTASSTGAATTTESSATGGTSTAATSEGTTVGTSEGTTATTAGTTGGVEPECVVDSDCQRVANCCECSSIPAGETPAECENDCLVDTCTAEGLESLEVACRSGVCEFGSTIACGGPVACDSLPPECDGDEVPSIVDECWGSCVPYHYCSDSSACTPGCGEDWTCVDSQSGGAGGCMPLAPGCGGVASCECVDPYWGEVCPSSCSDSGDGLLCNDGG